MWLSHGRSFNHSFDPRNGQILHILSNSVSSMNNHTYSLMLPLHGAGALLLAEAPTNDRPRLPGGLGPGYCNACTPSSPFIKKLHHQYYKDALHLSLSHFPRQLRLNSKESKSSIEKWRRGYATKEFSLGFSPVLSLVLSPVFSLLFSVIFFPVLSLVFLQVFSVVFSLVFFPVFSLSNLITPVQGSISHVIYNSTPWGRELLAEQITHTLVLATTVILIQSQYICSRQELFTSYCKSKAQTI